MSDRSHEKTISFERERGVTEILVRRGLAYFTVRDDSRNRLALLKGFADAAIPVFLVKFQPSGTSFALRREHLAGARQLLDAAATDYALEDEVALVSTIAGAMRDLSGVIAQIYDALIHAGVVVQQTGDAYNAVHCLVAGADADRAARALRGCFGIDEGGGA